MDISSAPHSEHSELQAVLPNTALHAADMYENAPLHFSDSTLHSNAIFHRRFLLRYALNGPQLHPSSYAMSMMMPFDGKGHNSGGVTR